MKKIELLHFTVAKKMTTARLESGLARINWIRAVDKICVEQLICCQKCRANDCRAIAFRAVHPHSQKIRKNSYLHFGKLSEHGTGKTNDTNLQIGWEKLQLFSFTRDLMTTKFQNLCLKLHFKV
jgi:hypothetical protein